jgi:hypothetical protein
VKSSVAAASRLKSTARWWCHPHHTVACLKRCLYQKPSRWYAPVPHFNFSFFFNLSNLSSQSSRLSSAHKFARRFAPGPAIIGFCVLQPHPHGSLWIYWILSLFAEARRPILMTTEAAAPNCFGTQAMLSCSYIFINIRWVDASSIFVVCIGTWALISWSLISIYIGWAHPSCIYIRTPWINWLHYNLLSCNLPSNACIDHIGYRKEQQFACVRLRRWMAMIFVFEILRAIPVPILSHGRDHVVSHSLLSPLN